MIPVRLFNWSSENHHIGRADGAIRLLDELASLKLQPTQRVLLFGHSHAGNVFALMTNLLCGDRRAIRRFFAAADIYYRWPVVGCIDIPAWGRVRDWLSSPVPPFSGRALDSRHAVYTRKRWLVFHAEEVTRRFYRRAA